MIRWHRWGGVTHEGLDRMFQGLEGYRSTFERLTGRPFYEARALEIGYGARPLRMLALLSMGLDVRGVDLDQPMLGFSLVTLYEIWRRNGLERALKTAVRGVVIDGGDRKRLRASLKQRGYTLRIDPARLLVGDAAIYDYGAEPVDFVYSEGVFEHIPSDRLETLVKRLAAQMSPQGLALITPDIFTGITGGHFPRWLMDHFEQGGPKDCEPWEHLRKRRYAANTYLNGLSRSDYRELFDRHFEVLEERVVYPDLGRQYLTPKVREELAIWSDEELFSNDVQFALRPRLQVRG